MLTREGNFSWGGLLFGAMILFILWAIAFGPLAGHRKESGILRGGVSWRSEKLTRDSIFTVEKCDPTPDGGLYNCFVDNEGRGSGWKFSTRPFEKGAKVQIVTFHCELNASEIYLLEPVDSHTAATLGIQ